MSTVDYMCGWAGGIATDVRLEEDKLLVVVEVRADGWKEMVALADGYRESTCSWADLLRDCARRGAQVPVLAVSDSAPGSCAARCKRSSRHPRAARLGAQDG
ncbi:hypothetical protein CSH63_05375 [Micromonospora tulbaghiae]|uniref:Mutator family transposase n=1 Tax=Micromonospora tulbaghiae TaxID=479978 RepID=A0A386WEZ1_9ACTN|nr:hypothetical protein CSH63_05375 [Micromonospora tulbaghiae]